MDENSFLLSDNDYSIITNGIQSKNNIKRKANLSIMECYNNRISHFLHWIHEFVEKYNRYPYIVEMMDASATINEELSLSKNGYGLKLFENIMTRNLKIKDKDRKDKDERD